MTCKSLFHLLAAAIALALPGAALAQNTFPTVTGSRIPGSVPLQCDASGANCAPITAANPLQVTGSSVPSGTAGTPSASVLSVQGVSGGTAVPVSAAQLPSTLGTKTAANSLAVTPASDASFATVETPTATAASGLVPSATTSAGSAQVVKASAGTLYGFSGYSTVSGFFLLFNATSAPADGAVTPVKCYPYVAATPLAVGYYPPLYLGTGATVVFSTTGCFTKTASATAFISGDAK